MKEPTGKAAGGYARASKLDEETRKKIGANAAATRWENEQKRKGLPHVIMKQNDLNLAGVTIPCAIIESQDGGEGVRVLTENGITYALLGERSGASKRLKKQSQLEGAPIPLFLAPPRLKPFINNELYGGLLTPIEYVDGKQIIIGYDARILPVVCEVWLKAREAGALQEQQLPKAQKAEILTRALAHVGIISLVDEATGYQNIRARNSLAKILEAFVAKELQPYVRTFPPEYYEHLFRIYGLPYPPPGNKGWRPSFFGKITNEVIYNRLAPELLPELKKAASKAEKKAKLFQWLTQDIGHPKLKEHLVSIVSLLKISTNPQEFMRYVGIAHPRYGEQLQIQFDDPNQARD